MHEHGLVHHPWDDSRRDFDAWDALHDEFSGDDGFGFSNIFLSVVRVRKQ